MKWMLSLLALATVVAASPSISTQLLPVNPGGIGGLFKGPNSEILIKGPDGSVITALNQGGEVHTGLASTPIVVAEPSVLAVSGDAPTVAVVPHLELSAPLATSRTAVEPVPVLVDNVATESEQSSDVHGSSGRILTKGSKAIIAGPASTTIADGGGVVETSAVPITSAHAVVGVADATSIGLTHGIAAVTAAPIVTSGVQLGSTAIPVSSGSIALGSTAIPIQSLGVSEPSDLLIGGADNLGAPALGVSAPALLSTLAPPQVVNLPSATSTLLQASVATSTLAPQIAATPTAKPLFVPTSGPVINGISPSKIDGRIDLGPPIHLNQLSLNAALIPSANIIPPEIGGGGGIRTLSPIVSSSTVVPDLVASPRAPGLGSVTTISSGNVQRSEIDALPLGGVGNEILIQQNARLQDPRLQEPRLQGVNLHDARLQGVNLQDPRLQSVNLQDPRLQGVNLHDPRLQGVNLQDAGLQGVNLQDPRLQNVNLQNPGLQGVNLQGPTLQNVNLQDARLQSVNDPRLQIENLQDPRLQGVNLQDPRQQNVNLQDARLQSVNDPRLQIENPQDPRLQGVNLQDQRLQDPRLQDVNLQNPRPQGVNLQGPTLQNVNLHDPRLQIVNIQDPSLQSVNLQDPRLQGVNLQDPRLQGVDLHDPRLHGVNLQDLRLQGVNLQDPSLQGAIVQDLRQPQPAPVQELAIEATPRSHVVLDGRLSLANVQQQDRQLLSAELAKSGIDAGEVQLTTVPLSAISRVVNPVVDSNGDLSGGLSRAQAPSSWNRWGRETKDE